MVGATAPVGARPWTSVAPSFEHLSSLALAPHVSALLRKRSVLSVVSHVHRCHRVLGVLLCGRTSATRRISAAEFLGHASLYVLSGAARMWHLARFQI